MCGPGRVVGPIEGQTLGFFGTYQFDGTEWAESDPERDPVGSEPWLWVDIHDSDFATVRYAPPGPGTGVAYLGATPRIYFESTDASPPTDVELEARGLATWWASRHLDASDEDQDAKQLQIAVFLAADEEPTDEEPVDDADIFVEIKTAQFLAAMSVPAPADLAP